MKRRVVILALVALAACGAARKDAETLPDSIRNYNEGVRWGRYAMAASSIPVRDRGDWVDEMDAREKDLKITDMEIVRVDQQSARAAKVQVKVSWYLESEGTLRETHELQQWERHGKEWWRVDATRLRGDPMPGLTEKTSEARQDTPEDTASADPK